MPPPGFPALLQKNAAEPDKLCGLNVFFAPRTGFDFSGKRAGQELASARKMRRFDRFPLPRRSVYFLRFPPGHSV